MSEADVVLMGPQISYRRKEFSELGDILGVPVAIIPSYDYGRVNAGKVLDLALASIG